MSIQRSTQLVVPTGCPNNVSHTINTITLKHEIMIY